MPMTYLVDRLPFYDHPTAVTVGGEQVFVKTDQIVLWITLREGAPSELGLHAPRFPAVLDTGLSHNLAIREEHLAEWAGLYPPLLEVEGHARLNGRRVRLLAARAWVYRNQPQRREVLESSPPFPLELRGGIAVYPQGTPGTPRLPVLGLRALRINKLRLRVDADRCLVSLRTRRRWWFFG